jgi:O-antigen ligase
MLELVARFQASGADDPASACGRGTIVPHYSSTPFGYALDSAGIETQPQTREKVSNQNRTTRFWSKLRRSRHGKLSRLEVRSKPLFVYPRATFTATLLFLLIYSGPPKFRLRDTEASLRGDVDWVVALHILVWGLAGAWVLFQMILKRDRAKLLVAGLRMPQKLGLAMILLLAVSAVISKAPALSAFKVYQMAVCLLFTQLFVQRFGYASCLKNIFWGTVLLCGAIAVCAFLAPDLVWIGSDFNPDPSRLRGDLIASNGTVSALATILLLTGVRKIWRVLPLALLGLFLGLLVFSLMRTGYLVILGFFVLVLMKRPNAKSLKQFAYLAGALALTVYACGWLPSLSQYRRPEDIANLGDRLGLWRYLSNITLTQSPWLGLGYYSASRVYGPQYNLGLGNAHSMFFEILLGGGVLSFALFLALCIMLSIYAACLLCKNRDRFSFAIVSLFFATLIFGSMGDEIDSGPAALCFWYSVAVLPWLYERSAVRAKRPVESRKQLPLTTGIQLSSEVP